MILQGHITELAIYSPNKIDAHTKESTNNGSIYKLFAHT